jgi:DNA-binding GntR family transcriptional regulator
MVGAWPDGAKLEAMRLADDLGVSMTPVRDSLNQLVGEGLVDLTPGEGFRVPLLTEQGLRDTLEVNAVLLEASMSDGWRLPDRSHTDASLDDYADRLAAVFSQLAAGSGNPFLAVLIKRISERLHRVRNREVEILPNALAMLEQIEASLQESPDDRRQAVQHYHRQSRVYVARLVGLLS